jgi:hypothetical protein
MPETIPAGLYRLDIHSLRVLGVEYIRCYYVSGMSSLDVSIL